MEDFRRWCRDQLDYVEQLNDALYYEGDTLAVQEAAAQVIVDAGDLLARLGCETLHAESRSLVKPEAEVVLGGMTHGPLASLQECEAFLVKCIGRCNELVGSTNGVPSGTAVVADKPTLKQKDEMVYRQYKHAEEMLRERRPSQIVRDRDAHKYLVERGETDLKFDTWTRYLRRARRSYGDQKHSFQQQ